MSPQIAFDPTEYDFIIIRHTSGMYHLEPWKMAGRLEAAMDAVIADLFDGKCDNLDYAEFSLGFVAALDVLGHGNLRLWQARDRSALADAIDKAYANMHGRVVREPNTQFMTEALKRISRRKGDGGSR